MSIIAKTITGTGTYKLPPGMTTEFFLAEDWRLILVEEGSALYTIDGVKYSVEAGSLFLLGPNKRKISTAGKEAFKVSIIFFSEHKRPVEAELLQFKNRDQSYRLLRETFNEIHSHERFIYHLDMLNSLLHVFRRDHSTETSGDFRIRQAIQILKQQNGWRMTAEQLSAKVGLSRSYFNTLFRTYTGKNFNAYCQEMRMQLALTLIQEFGFSSKQTAIEIGSSSAQAFSREFKTYFGLPPKKYSTKFM